MTTAKCGRDDSHNGHKLPVGFCAGNQGVVVAVVADPFDAAIAYATKEGQQAGMTAASWFFDGNTTDATYRAVLRRIEDQDVDDLLPFADLSGQWANTPTGPQLVDDALNAAGVYLDADGDVDETAGDDERDEWFSDICDAYETAFNDAATDEIERVARYHVDAATPDAIETLLGW